ncbi:MAG: hypothetical protein QOE90_1032 [Thermoplasmata archaeon]|jgi:hypothetical protein|nr:hypothetical protein [Thermoplasmata archaeon]
MARLKTRQQSSFAWVAGSLLLASCLAVLVTPSAQAATTYQPPQLTNAAVQTATLTTAQAYANAVPGLDAKTLRWFLYSVEHRESTFSATFCNYNDGAGGWNKPLSSFWPTSDHLPHGCGLTQLTGWTHEGMTYPGNSGSAPTMLGKGIYGSIAPPRPVTPLSNPFDPQQNLDRFVTEEVLPDFLVIQKTYPSFTTEQVLRAVAFHWNKGEYQKYDPNNCDYLCLYDKYVAVYKPAVLNDYTWPASGGTTTPPPAPAPSPLPSPSPTTFTLSPNVNAWWIEVSVSGGPSAVNAIVNGGAPVPLTHESWGTWAASVHAPAGSQVSFTAIVNGAAVASPTYAWLGAAPPAPAPAPAPIPTANAPTFAVSPNVNTWWVEVKVSGSPSAVSATIDGGAPIALRATSWGTWALSTHVASGAQVTFTATVGGVAYTSAATTWR